MKAPDLIERVQRFYNVPAATSNLLASKTHPMKITFCISYRQWPGRFPFKAFSSFFHQQEHCFYYASVSFRIIISFHVVDMRQIKYWVSLAVGKQDGE